MAGAWMIFWLALLFGTIKPARLLQRYSALNYVYLGMAFTPLEPRHVKRDFAYRNLG